MDKELFERTEIQLKRYFSKDKIIKSLKDKLFLLDKQIRSIDEDLRKCNVSIEPESKSPSFEERVQTSSDGMSYAEKEILRVTEYKIKRMTEKQMEREKTLEQIDQIEIDYNFIKDAIEVIQGQARQLLELKYKKGFGEQQIGNILHLTQPQVNKKKWRLVKKIADWDQWGKIS
ncbi:hypothetical protein [Clostridium beijerinckii]|uniref:hypothetical protein n=1 Tax=Clostridium beijerinckii TaxID=1520 RepID=UPI001361D703|nr:hypothetical protein [Clostridium beijerinckii]MZK53473.1 hypothetical protein [Clostridium beijerinckii]MZK61611.1 hypothetical protein [Clostridium beijerinckii]MZK71836.1 hypothetical protein [Clostridium beijerinckii]MZK77240.1 hypothetical protein [Clostridium beijerinckii]MZK86319.1 hypothetical protein [Clostridium beijerinckii]